MNVLAILATLNQATVFLLVGVVLLLINIVYGWVRTARGNLKAGWFTVGLALVACVLIAVGAVQGAAIAQQGPRGPFAGRSTTFNNAPSTSANAPSDSTVSISNTTSGSARATDQAVAQAPTATDTNATQAATQAGTAQAAGTPGRRSGGNRRGTPGANGAAAPGSTGGNSGNSANSGGSSNNGADNSGNPSAGNPNAANPGGRGQSAAASADQSPAAQINQSALLIAAIGGGLAVVLGLVLYFAERRRPGFSAANSRGLINIAAGLFIVIAALVIPIILMQSTVSAAPARGIAGNARARAMTATPSVTALPSSTPTVVPTLTPAPTDTPVAMPTQIPYTSTYTVDMQQSVCTATASTTINLRLDPSVQQQAIGHTVGGSLLNVTGRSADNQWLRVITADSSVEGWVNTSFVTLGSSCANIPVVNASGAATTSPTPRAATSSSAAGSNTGSNARSSATVSATPAPCVLMTTSPAALRPAPSRASAAIASIPDKTALNAVGKSADGSWWQVNYGSAKGWIGAGVVLASSGCSSVPVVTP